MTGTDPRGIDHPTRTGRVDDFGQPKSERQAYIDGTGILRPRSFRGITIDLYLLLFEALFEGALVLAAALLVATYLALLKMHNDVRRARMFIMADRVKRFLGAFTFAFVVITLDVSTTVLGLRLPATVAVAVVFLFLGAIVYGSLELFLIVRPPHRRVFGSRSGAPETAPRAPPDPPPKEDAPEGGMNAAR